MRLSVQFGGVETCKLTSREQLKFHTPKKQGDRAWKIIDEETGEIIDQYTPTKKKKPVAQTRYEGSWAHQEKLRREAK